MIIEILRTEIELNSRQQDPRSLLEVISSNCIIMISNLTEQLVGVLDIFQFVLAVIISFPSSSYNGAHGYRCLFHIVHIVTATLATCAINLVLMSTLLYVLAAEHFFCINYDFY